MRCVIEEEQPSPVKRRCGRPALQPPDLTASLFAGSTHTVHDAATALLRLQTTHKLPNTATEDIFKTVKLFLPADNSMLIYAHAKRFIGMIGAVTRDACVNDCVLFPPKHEDGDDPVTHCPEPSCMAPRFDATRTPPRKVPCTPTYDFARELTQTHVS